MLTRKRLLHAIINLVAWSVFGLFMAGQVYFTTRRLGRPISWESALASEMIYAYAWAILTPLVLALSRRFRLERRRLTGVLVLHAVMSLMVALSHRAMYVVAHSLWQTAFIAEPFSWQTVNKNLIAYLDYGILLYWMIVVLHHAFEYYRRYQERDLKASQLEARLAQAQLQALRMQLQPHFLFNTLNAISVLIAKNPDAARQMLRRLSGLLRLTLDEAGEQFVPLERELDFLERYLQIEQMRFGDRLSIQKNVAPETLAAQVPNFILQPLVENAIRHGVNEQRGQAVIAISAQRDNGVLHLEVRDNGSGLAAADQNGRKKGIGLSNTRSRLEQLYGCNYHFALSNAEAGGVIAALIIPFQIHDANQSDSLESQSSK